ncbi:MAG TPA: extracellular solute-binding protein [Thermomicrobiales bacterium]|jgi:multiple sugar transport system substrate-binding protein
MDAADQDGATTKRTRPTLTRRQFTRRFGLAAGGLLALPLLAACSRNAPPTMQQEGAPTVSGDPATPTVPSHPTFREGATLTLLMAGSTAPAADDTLRALAAEWGREQHVAVTVETVGNAALRARLATPGAIDGIDIVQVRDNLPWLYADRFADLSVETEELGTALGGYYDAPAAQAHVSGAWRALPFSVAPSAVIYRTDWLKAAGASSFPTTTDGLLALGKAWKAAGHPFGAPAGRSVEDPRALWYAVLWAFGGRVTEVDGKTIAINTPETAAAIEWAKGFWNSACLPEGLSWDDSGNNLAYANAQIAATQNGPGLYLKLKQEAPDVAAVSALAPFPAGPGGQAAPVTTRAHAVLKTSTNAEAARAFLLWLGQRAQTERYLDAGGGALVAALRAFEDSPLWSRDPQLRAFVAAASAGRWIGWPAAPSRAADDTDAHFVIVDMFANVFAGKNIQLSIGEAESALRGIYAS